MTTTTTDEPTVSSQARWRKAVEWPLTVTAVVFLIAYTWQIVGNLHGAGADFTEGVIVVTWAVFVVDYVVNLTLAERRWQWFRSHILDLLIVALPLLRPLRLLRLVTLLAVLQRTAGAAFRGRVVVYVAGASALLVYVAALAVLDGERGNPDANIKTFPDAVWWAFTTVTTVGYGDRFPVTDLGRIIAVFLMLGGIALIGVITATLASWIVEKVSQHDDANEAATRGEIRRLSQQLASLEDVLRQRKFGDDRPGEVCDNCGTRSD